MTNLNHGRFLIFSAIILQSDKQVGL